VLMTSGAANAAVEALWRSLPEREGATSDVAGDIDPESLLPTRRAHFRYVGSLTTPPCTEGVQWVVYSTPVEVSAEQVARFAALFPHNARPVMPLNRRRLE